MSSPHACHMASPTSAPGEDALWKLAVAPLHPDAAMSLADAIEENMATGAVSCFAISGAADVWSVEVLVDSRPTPAQQAMVEDTVARIVAGIGGPSPRITWRPVEDEDWVARS